MIYQERLEEAIQLESKRHEEKVARVAEIGEQTSKEEPNIRAVPDSEPNIDPPQGLSSPRCEASRDSKARSRARGPETGQTGPPRGSGAA